MYEGSIDSPVGRLRAVASDAGLRALLWPDERDRVRLPSTTPAEHHPIVEQARSEITEYFTGTRRTFDVPLDMTGTAFQREVWDALTKIPFGDTRTYGELAIQLGRPSAARAVGAANGKNPVSIIVPCHRVVGSDGSLTGFAGGIDTKATLLAHERSAV